MERAQTLCETFSTEINIWLASLDFSRKNHVLLRLLMLKIKTTSEHINVLVKFSLRLQSDPGTRAAGWTRAQCIVSLSVLGSTCNSVLLGIMIAYQDVDDISLSWCRSSSDLHEPISFAYLWLMRWANKNLPRVLCHGHLNGYRVISVSAPIAV